MSNGGNRGWKFGKITQPFPSLFWKRRKLYIIYLFQPLKSFFFRLNSDYIMCRNEDIGDSQAWEILSGSRLKTHFRHFPSALNSKLYYSFQSPHGGVHLALTKKTNKRTIACPDVFMMTAKYTDAFSFLITKSHSWSLVCTLNTTLDQ